MRQMALYMRLRHGDMRRCLPLMSDITRAMFYACAASAAFMLQLRCYEVGSAAFYAALYFCRACCRCRCLPLRRR